MSPVVDAKKVQFTDLPSPAATVRQKYYVSIIGPSAVGKTSISTQAATGTFNHMYNPTIEKTHFVSMTRNGAEYVIDVMDTMGANGSACHHVPDRVILRKQGVIVVYSLSDRDSYITARQMCEDLVPDKVEPSCYPVLLVGNKSDELDGADSGHEDEAIGIADELEITHVRCSARNTEDVANVFQMLLERLVTANSPETQMDI